MKSWLRQGLTDPLTLVRTEDMGVDVGMMVDMVAGGFASSLIKFSQCNNKAGYKIRVKKELATFGCLQRKKL